MNLGSHLQELGLSEQEATIYIATLKLGSSKASAIASEAGIKRTTVYHELKSLAQKGFVIVQFVGKERCYRAQPPRKLANYYKGKLQSFEKIIPQLAELERKHAQIVGIRFIETVAELRHFYDDILVEYANDQYFVIGDAAGWEGMAPTFFPQYRLRRAAANIRTKLLLTSTSQPFNPTDPALLRSVKYLPSGYRFKSTMDIFDDKILIVSPELTSLAVVIEVAAMTDIFKTLFQILWDMIEMEA